MSETLPALAAGSKAVALVPSTLGEIQQLASIIARSGMAPKSYLKNPKRWDDGYSEERIMVGILHGLEVGLTPLAALQSIAVVNGMPSIWGDGALALVLSSGLVDDFEEKLEETENDRIAVCRFNRKGRPTPIIRKFSWRDAQRAELDKKDGSWQGYPPRMLQMRARAWALRDGFADVLKGLHIGEEARDIAPEPVSPPAPRPKRSDYVAPKDAIEAEVVKDELVEEPEDGFDPATFSAGFLSLLFGCTDPSKIKPIIEENLDEIRRLSADHQADLLRRANARFTEFSEPAVTEPPVTQPPITTPAPEQALVGRDILTPWKADEPGFASCGKAICEVLGTATTVAEFDALLAVPERAALIQWLRDKAPKRVGTLETLIRQNRELLEAGERA